MATIGPLSPFQKLTGIHFESKSTSKGLLTCSFEFFGGAKLVGETTYFPPDSTPGTALTQQDVTFTQGKTPTLLYYLVAESSPGTVIQKQGPFPMNVGLQTIITTTTLRGTGEGLVVTNVLNEEGPQPLPFNFSCTLTNIPDTANIALVVTSADEELYPPAFLPGYTASAQDTVTTIIKGNTKTSIKKIIGYTLEDFSSNINADIASTGWWAWPVQFNWQLGIIAFGHIANPTPPLE